MRAPEWRDLHSDLAALHAAALVAADPRRAVAGEVARCGDNVILAGEPIRLARHASVWLIAAGKAASGMTAGCSALDGKISGGLVIEPQGAPPAPDELAPLPRNVTRLAASHPLPDESSLAAGAAVERLLARAGADDLVLVLLSGGASALLESLPEGVSLADLRRVTERLQRAGADIVELNTVRRALSRLKGGRLARLAEPAIVATLALSDVVGDRPETIGSGPTVDSPTGPEEALRILRRHGLDRELPEIVTVLRATAPQAPANRPAEEIFRVVASNRHATEAVARAAAARGFRAQVMTTILQGEARDAGRAVGELAVGAAARGVPAGAPACWVFGGETTVTVRGSGRGGRNHELALGAALVLAGCRRAAVLSFATDGVDGSSAAAGALATGETVARAEAMGLSPLRALADNDSGPFFRALGDSWGTGPTGTNVNDLVVALVYP